MSLGQINSIWDFLVKNNRYLSFIPIAFGIIGPFKKHASGWIFTATVFYLLIILGIVVGVENELKSFYEISTYLLFMTTMVFPLIIMNSDDFKLYYSIDISKRLWKENIISMGTMMILGILLILLNG